MKTKIERVMIRELLAAASAKRRTKVTRTEFADHVFADDVARPRYGVQASMSQERKQQLVWQWDKGQSMTALKPRHLLRMADFLKVYDIRKLVQEVETTNPEEGD